MAGTEREFDIVLWGASGFTGQLVAEYLLGRYGVDGAFRWALGGRNEVKLDAVRDRLGAAELPLVLGDGADADSMKSLAERTRVVCTTVGPYATYGSPLVAACARAGTHYCDLTGELHWIRRMLDEHQETARSSGARIVPTCGFDSIPSDLGVYYVQAAARERYGAPCPSVKCGVAGFSGGMSGGTVASMLHMMEEAEGDREIRRIMSDPYAINPQGEREGPDGPDRSAPAYDADLGQWTAPFMMAGINTRVVRRSAALLRDLYGPDFRYQEAMLTGTGAAGALKASGVAVGMNAGMTAMALGPVRRAVAPRLPAPGEGPSRQQQEAGYWDLRFFGAPPAGSEARPIQARLRGDRDPGYGSTSKMLGESAVCLAQDHLEAVTGFLTPAAAMGQSLIDRLQKNAGVSFEVTG